MDALIKEESGAKRVVVFDHTLRTGDLDDREAKKIREPVQRVHNDYTEWSGPQRVRDLMGRSGGFADAPLRHHPGVAADPPAGGKPPPRHLRCPQHRLRGFRDLRTRYPNRVGRATVNYSPRHQWYWFPRMRRERRWYSWSTIR